MLNRKIFYNIKEAKVVIENWRKEYNTVRQHCRLHDLTQNNKKLLLTRGLYKCDAEIHIREADESWRLKVVPKIQKMHIQTHTWEMTYDDQNFFRMQEQQMREARAMKARSKGQLPLNDNEMKIIDAIWCRGPMSVKQIAEATGISRSTVDQKLKALEKPSKGEWIVSLDGENGKLYMADPNIPPEKETKAVEGQHVQRQQNYHGLIEEVDTRMYSNKLICACGNVRWVKNADLFQVKKCKPCTYKERKERRRQRRLSR